MTEAEREVIKNFALGNNRLRDEAIRIHRKDIREHGLRRGNVHFDFMSEIDNPCPDFLLRARYRRQLTGEDK